MSPPWMPLYIADYRADTAHLSAAEHGAYLLLIMHHWQTGALPTDERQLARIACMTEREWKQSRHTLASFFDAQWKHKRVTEELAHATDVISKRRDAALRMHSKRGAKAHANAPANNGDAGVPQPPKSSEASASGAEAPADPSIAERDLYARGKAVLGKSAGGLITDLLKAKGGNVALARSVVEEASTKHNAREFVGGAVRGPRGGMNGNHQQPSVQDFARRLAGQLQREDAGEPLFGVGSR